MESSTIPVESGSPWTPQVRELLQTWLSLPKDRPAELLGGQIVYRAMGNFDHGAAQLGVGSQLFGAQGPEGVANPEGGELAHASSVPSKRVGQRERRSSRAEPLPGQGGSEQSEFAESGGATQKKQPSRARQGPGWLRGRWWISQEVDVYVGGEGLRPDVVGWRLERHPEPPPRVNVARFLGVIVAPPDWVCEVLSVSTAARDRNLKRQAYHRGGVEWYWVVDVPNRSVTVYRRTAASYELVDIATGGEIVHLPPFDQQDFIPERLFLRPREG